MRVAVAVLLALLVGLAAAQHDIWPGAPSIRSGGNLDWFGTTRGTALGTAVKAGVSMPTPLTRAEVARLVTVGPAVQRTGTAVLANMRAYPFVWMLGVGAVVAATDWYIDWAGRQVPVPPSLEGSEGGCPAPVWAESGTVFTSGNIYPTNHSDLSSCTTGAMPPTAGGFRPYSGLESNDQGIKYGVWSNQSNSGVSGWIYVETPRPAECTGTAAEARKCRYEVAIVKANATWSAFLAYVDVPVAGDRAGALTNDPAAQDFAREHAVPNWMQQTIPQVQEDPHTWEQPWPTNPYVTFPPGHRPSWHVWQEYCYGVTIGVDTDGDGWPDWIECRLGTNPFDPNSKPNATGDPDGDGFTNDQERIAMTDPLDPDDRPGEAGVPLVPPEGDPDAVPVRADLQAVEAAIRDLTQQLTDISTASRQDQQTAILETQLDELRNIRDALEGEPVPVLTAPELAELDDGPWVALSATVDAAVNDLQATMLTRLPFALGDFVPTPTVTGGGSCAAVGMPILGTTQQVGLCDTPVHDFMTGPGRLVLLAVAVLGFWMAAASTVAKA